jgi:hypothetical protein
MSNKAPRLCRHCEKPAQSRTGRPVCSECRERLIKEANTRYQKSEPFRATQARFSVGKKPRAILKRYNRSEKGHQTGKRYRNTERGCANSFSRRHAQHALVVTPVELRLTAEQWRAILERWDYDRVEFCTKCGAEIVMQRHAGNSLISEYRSRDGKCFACTFVPTTTKVLA